jgi:hypothetical protein
MCNLWITRWGYDAAAGLQPCARRERPQPGRSRLARCTRAASGSSPDCVTVDGASARRNDCNLAEARVLVEAAVREGEGLARICFLQLDITHVPVRG